MSEGQTSWKQQGKKEVFYIISASEKKVTYTFSHQLILKSSLSFL
jgi:hypothetical protein